LHFDGRFGFVAIVDRANRRTLPMRRLSIDIGGTFTDLLVYDDSTGEITVADREVQPPD
jgi:hypothetical protein